MSQSILAEIINATESRYQAQQDKQAQYPQHQTVGGDWRKVESPERVMRRMNSLGLHQLASELIAKETVTESVSSTIRVDEQVSVLERILEENDLISSRFLQRGSQVARAVGRITLRSGGRNIGFGTGFLVSDQLLLTNNHVLENEAIAGESFIEFDFFERRDGSTRPVELSRLDPRTFFLTDRSLDYTLVGVMPRSDTGAALSERGSIPLIPGSGKALIGEPVNIIQHPSGDPQQIAIRNNNITDAIPDFLHYEADTERGSSGSPVLNMQWELAALHHSGIPKKNALGQILLTDGTIFDGQKKNEGRIAWQANEGVRISSIVNHIRDRLRTDTDRRRQQLFDHAIQHESQTIRVESEPTIPRTIPIAEAVISQQSLTTSSMDGMTDEMLDQMTPEAISELLSELDSSSPQGLLESTRQETQIVAEGDSWFDYGPAGLDVISCLKRFFNYKIHNISKAGDTLDNMAWGTGYDKKNWRKKSAPLQETLEAIEKHQPRVVLLSGGGNDVAGDELFSFLNHKDSKLPPLREQYTDFIIKEYYLKAFQHITTKIWEKDASIQIVLHGYGYPVPDGRAVIRLLGLSFIGPWLRPSLVAKGYETRTEQDQIVRKLINDFNTMLSQFAATNSNLHYIDLRSAISDSDWVNELHLKNSAYRRVAGKFNEVIQPLLRHT